MTSYFDELNMAVTICDLEATILYMNHKAKKTFEKYGEESFIGKSLYDCHNEKSCEMIKSMLKNNTSNSYTIEKLGVKKLIHQTPWYQEGSVAGLIEFSIELPAELPHFIRT